MCPGRRRKRPRTWIAEQRILLRERQHPDCRKGMMSGGSSLSKSERRSIAPREEPERTLDSPERVTRTQIELPVATILKVLVTIALLLILGQIWQNLLLVFIGMFVAMVLARPVSWLQG